MDMNSLTQRTMGDGMDCSLINFSEIISKNLSQVKLGAVHHSTKPITPQGPIIRTIPKYIPKECKKPSYLVKKPKEAKFVPYEPFKAAVDPIIPKKRVLKVNSPPISKNNVDIQDLVHQMSEMRSVELGKEKKEALMNNESIITMKQWEDDRLAYETDIKNLRETNAHLENQLKFQAQVNSELKTLLVAAVGEDLESRVQHLTEDKLQLARALLNSANHLTSHQEQTEWLSGQCEVWRSKFLASSLMVEELARWKSAFSYRINDLQENLKLLINERTKVRNSALKTYKVLTRIDETLPERTLSCLKSTNIIDLAVNNCKLAEHIGGHFVKEDKELDENILKLPTNTPGENAAARILKNQVSLTYKPDAVCNALMGAAMSLSGGQMYLQHPTMHATCCKHCTGEIHDI
ncbi:PREDICTED: golgin-45 [Nicrophorus vespilloides]|uniref:Golgin-45 n=1 Tax=Nicrophorus vespilloides TaxID=110193 RepID=A0ABM1MBX3_NICVS|nr:PREDICTED: golgin-45 [Nicrophorus vespilloides]